MRPILKWAGGKARLAKQIDEAFRDPCSGTYYEPFIGGAAVFLHRRRKKRIERAVLSDANAKLIALYAALRDDVEGVLDALARLPMRDWRERYYDVRDAFNAGPHHGAAHAARFLWLNRTCFNGLYRENLKGGYNVPVGRYARLSLPAPEKLRNVSKALAGVELRACSFEEVLAEAGADDQVYCDPPYVPLSATASFTAYCKAAFGPEEQQALADAAHAAATRGARVVLSNHDVPIVRQELYTKERGFRVVFNPDVKRSISRKGSSREPVREVIAAIDPRTVAL